MEFSKKKNKSPFFGNSVAFVFLLICICFVIINIPSLLKLPEVSTRSTVIGAYKNKKFNFYEEEKLGKIGEIMVHMLPDDLAFTLFLPSEQSFERDLKLRLTDCMGAEKMNDTYAILSRVLGFSAVPRAVYSESVHSGEEIDFDSLSGFKLYVSKELNGDLIVNRVRAELMDIRRGEIVVHIMDGAIMDADFEQSFQEDED